MQPSERISIAMCTYNGARYLREQLDSIARQTLLPYELVVCDDGSSDDTIDILRDFGATAPFRVRIYENELNLRPTKNFEKAIVLCEGDFIALCDQDDYWLPRKLQTLTEYMNCTGAGGIFTDGELMDDGSKTTGQTLWKSIFFTPTEQQAWVQGDWPSVLLKRNVVTGATLMFRQNLRDCLLPIPQCWVHDGWFAWMISLYSKLSFLPTPFIRYRVHREQQIGVPSASLQKRIQKARATGTAEYNLIADQFSALKEQIEGFESIPSLGSKVQMKIKHSKFRANLNPSRPKRFKTVLLEYQNYSLYSQGIYSMLKDLII